MQLRPFSMELDWERIKEMDLRPQDLAEIELTTGGKPPAAAIQDSVLKSDEVHVAVNEDGGIIMIYGLGSHPSGFGIPWMIASNELYRHTFTLLKHGRMVVRRFLERHPILCNLVDARNTVSINWLRWMGFTIRDSEDPRFKLFYKENPT